ncbi:hypothetical protein OAO87_03425 [bacterium]|nr:hypothetical protein [bacterium]
MRRAVFVAAALFAQVDCALHLEGDKIVFTQNDGQRCVLGMAEGGLQTTCAISQVESFAGDSSMSISSPPPLTPPPSSPPTPYVNIPISADAGTYVGDQPYQPGYPTTPFLPSGSVSLFPGGADGSFGSGSSTTPRTYYFGKDWGEGDAKYITRAELSSQPTHGFRGGTDTSYIGTLQGSQDGTGWSDLSDSVTISGETAGANVMTLVATVIQPYQYHRVKVVAGDSYELYVGIELFEAQFAGALLAPDAAVSSIPASAGTYVGDQPYQPGYPTTPFVPSGSVSLFPGGADGSFGSGSSTTPRTYYFGKDWGEGDAKYVTRAELSSQPTHGFRGGTDTSYIGTLQGSQDGTGWSDLSDSVTISGETAGANVMTLTANPSSSFPFRYHRVKVVAGDSYELYVGIVFFGVDGLV